MPESRIVCVELKGDNLESIDYSPLHSRAIETGLGSVVIGIGLREGELENGDFVVYRLESEGLEEDCAIFYWMLGEGIAFPGVIDLLKRGARVLKVLGYNARVDPNAIVSI